MANLSFEGLGLSVADVEAIRDTALANLKAGVLITSWAVGETSSGRQPVAQTEEVLHACRDFLQRNAPDIYGPAVTRTKANFS